MNPVSHEQHTALVSEVQRIQKFLQRMLIYIRESEPNQKTIAHLTLFELESIIEAAVSMADSHDESIDEQWKKTIDWLKTLPTQDTEPENKPTELS
jgi:hypothetical protein